jgi:hypothetical protein
MAQTYCGNNALYPGIVAGTHIQGTRLQCLRKGFGIGSNLPYDASFAGLYAPVDGRRFYCGNAPVAPVGYFAVGSSSKCLQIGVGGGKRQRAAGGAPAFMYFIRHVLPYLSFIVISVIVFSTIYYTRPKFITKIENKKEVIDWARFTPWFISFCLIIAVLIFWFWKRHVRTWI